MHICADEILAFTLALPFLGFAVRWTRARFAGLMSRRTR